MQQANSRSSSSSNNSLQASNETSLTAWIVLFFAILLNMSINLRWSTFSPVASVAADYMQVNLSAITWLSNCATLIYIAIGFCTGWIFEKYGIRISFILAAATNIVGSWIRYFGVFAPVSQRYGVIMFGQCVASIAEPFIMNIGTHFAAIWFSAKHRVTANTLISLPMGMIVATLSIPRIAVTADDMPKALLIVACISTACGIPFLFLPAGPKLPPSESAKVKRLTFRQSLRLLLSSRNYILLVFIFSIGFCMWASIVAITNYIFTPYGFSNKDVGLASFVRIMGGVAGALIAGRITDWTGRHALVLQVATWMTVITTVILYIQDYVNTYAFMFVSCFLHGFFVFLIFPVSLELAAEVTFPVPESVSTSILCLFCQIGSFVTTYVLDALRDTSPSAHPPGNMKHALIYAIVLSVLGAIPSLFLRQDLRRIHHDREGCPVERHQSFLQEAQDDIRSRQQAEPLPLSEDIQVIMANTKN